MSDVLLALRDLRTSFRIQGKYYAAVDGINLDVYENEVLALVGESGSGKSATALTITKLHNENYTRMEGEVLFDDKELLGLTENQLNKVRGRRIGMIFQDPLSALNPLIRIGAQIEESLTFHTDLDASGRKARALELLEAVGMVNPALTYRQLPHQLSGGMRQRVVIAIAIACKPSLLIADEPTTALDVTIQAQILDLLRDLQKETKASIILITHDLGVVAEMADRVAVMYAGQIVELAPAMELFTNPQHPYTRSLLASIPSADKQDDHLHVIQGVVPPLQHLPREGCRFSLRTPWVPENIHELEPTYHEISPGHLVLCTCYKKFTFDGEEAV
ncbi:MAG: ABC transporter ATP-binding protein [Defluviitaleaceae bacterium]|nr:ABC transporter ATP-binding protein [Defluviitaleaceae bacterium]